jgi:subtilisin
MDLKRGSLIIVNAVILLMLHGLAVSADKSFIVGFHQKPGPSEEALIHGAKGIIKRTYHLIPAMAASLPEEAVEQIKKSGKVAYVEEDGVFMAVEPVPGNEYMNAWGVQHIGAETAHESGNKGAGVKVAVIDTGIDYTHEDLDDNYRGGYDFVFRDGDPFDDNRYSHGTHTAGIIAAEQNGTGVAGVAPEAELYAVKVLDGGGFGLLSWIIAGIEWAVNNHMNIANLSLEGPDFQSLHDACDAAYEAGVLVVAAGGNTNGGRVRFPAAYSSVIAVTATDQYDVPAYFSPVGPEVELAAPGMNILSTVAGGGYDVLSGTSQAAPHVSGTAALFFTTDLQDVNGDGIINNKDVRQMLQSTALDLGALSLDPVFGFGLVNAAAAFYPADELAVSISRTAAPPDHDAVTVPVSGTSHEMTIKNYGLSRVSVQVLKEGVYQKDLSLSYSFGGKKPQDITFYIEETGGTSYDVRFTPYGQPGTFADIIITTE